VIQVKFEKLSTSASEKIYLSWAENSLPSVELTPDELKLRNEILKINKIVCEDERSGIKVGKIDKYQFDLLFGLEIYELLNETIGFTMRHASDPDIWRNMTMKIAPDIVYTRWKKENNDRYYRRTTRIYFSSIWWYIHLSWEGNKIKTYELLKSNTTDEIMNLVERSGPMGYRIDFTRELMKQYCEKKSDNDRFLFRKLLKLNIARCVVLEPALHGNGLVGYVDTLFQDVMKGEIHEEASGSY